MVNDTPMLLTVSEAASCLRTSRAAIYNRRWSSASRSLGSSAWDDACSSTEHLWYTG